MMCRALGLDTSNYTTSAALFDRESGLLEQEKLMLPVESGQLGLRQSDALFHHVQQLPTVIERLFSKRGFSPDVIGVSTRPRPVEGSYMPCFEAGRSSAEQLGAVLGVPVLRFSHQEGHIAAAAYDSGFPLGDEKPFLAFHLSGGTTEAVLVQKADSGFSIEYLCGSLDLKAGQLIDRIALALGLPFPGGAPLEKLALEWEAPVVCRPTMRGMNCCLSGVENICKKALQNGESGEYVARLCLESVISAVCAMTEAVFAERGEMPVLFSGGVSSNSLLRERASRLYGAYFAKPQFSCDNAAGIAILAAGGLGES